LLVWREDNNASEVVFLNRLLFLGEESSDGLSARFDYSDYIVQDFAMSDGFEHVERTALTSGTIEDNGFGVNEELSEEGDIFTKCLQVNV